MSGENIVNYDSISSVNKELVAKYSELKEINQDIIALCDKISNGSVWNGAGSNSFSEKFKTNVNEYCTKLESISKFITNLNGALNIYKSLEVDSSNKVANISTGFLLSPLATVVSSGISSSKNSDSSLLNRGAEQLNLRGNDIIGTGVNNNTKVTETNKGEEQLNLVGAGTSDSSNISTLMSKEDFAKTTSIPILMYGTTVKVPYSETQGTSNRDIANYILDQQYEKYVNTNSLGGEN